MAFFKRVVNRLYGHGPYRAWPFRKIVAARVDERRGVHQAERFDGVLETESTAPAVYRPGESLLKQVPQSELVDGNARYLSGGIAPGASVSLFGLTDGGVIGTDAVVYCPQTRAAVREAMRSWSGPINAHPVFSAPRLPPAIPLPGLSLSLGTLDGGGFFHFLLEALPRLRLARSFLGEVRHFLANGAPGSFQVRWLQQAGVPTEKIVWLGGLSHFRCEELLFTNFPMTDHQPTEWVIAAVREMLSAPPPEKPGTRRIWISRSDARARQPAWEKAFVAALPGFESLALSTLSPSEQIETMRSATVVAAPHGAGLANLVFCAPGTKLVEIFPDENRRPIYQRLASVCGLAHGWAVADFAAPTPPNGLVAAVQQFLHE